MIGAALAIALAAVAAWFWLVREPEIREPTSIDVVPEPIAEPQTRAPVLRAPPAVSAVAPTRAPESEPAPSATSIPLPALDTSDPEATAVATELLGPRNVEQTLRPDDLIRRFVLTVDSLPRPELSLEKRATFALPGAFAVRETDDEILLSNQNFARYTTFATLVSRLSAPRIATLYRRYYPLLQEAYLELGHPADSTFDKRIDEVIDHLLGTPEIAGPIRLTRPNVLYEFADPNVESLSAGRKILIRMGPINAAIVKAKLREIRPLLDP